MFDGVLRPDVQSENRLVLRFPIASNIVFGALAGAIGFGVLQAGRLLVVPLLLAIGAAAAALYRERWVFDREGGTIEHLNGFVPFVRRTVYSIADVESVTYEQFRLGQPTASVQMNELPDAAVRGGFAGMGRPTLARVSLDFNESSGGAIVNIETSRGHGCSRLLVLGQRVAEFVGVTLRTQA